MKMIYFYVLNFLYSKVVGRNASGSFDRLGGPHKTCAVVWPLLLYTVAALANFLGFLWFERRKIVMGLNPGLAFNQKLYTF